MPHFQTCHKHWCQQTLRSLCVHRKKIHISVLDILTIISLLCVCVTDMDFYGMPGCCHAMAITSNIEWSVFTYGLSRKTALTLI